MSGASCTEQSLAKLALTTLPAHLWCATMVITITLAYDGFVWAASAPPAILVTMGISIPFSEKIIVMLQCLQQTYLPNFMKHVLGPVENSYRLTKSGSIVYFFSEFHQLLWTVAVNI